VGTEHILLGLIKDSSGVAALVLKNLGINPRQIVEEIGKLVQPGPNKVPSGNSPQTPRAKTVIEEALEEARNVMKSLGLDLGKVRVEVAKVVQPGPDKVPSGKSPQTPRAKKVIEYAIEEARSLNHDTIDTLHLLLGLVREPDGVAGIVLRNLGL